MVAKPLLPAARAGVMLLSAALLILSAAVLPAAAAKPDRPGGGSAAVDLVAIGDSYTAGQGAGPYADPACYGSLDKDYPAVADAALKGLTLTSNRACSGASAAGIASQLPSTADPSIELVTLTVGGIDAGSNQVASACPGGTVTQACIDLLTLTDEEQTALISTLTAAYTQVKAAFPNARVVPVGYPRFFTGLYLFSDFPRRLNASIDTLNEVLKRAAAANSLKFVDVRDEFSGHEIGAFSGQWINYGAADPNEDFHPNATGYRSGYYQALVNDGVLPKR